MRAVRPIERTAPGATSGVRACLLLTLAVACGGSPSPGSKVITPPPPPPLRTVDVLAYNVWLLPPVARDMEERVRFLPHHLLGYDVIVLSEAFQDDYRGAVVEAMRASGFESTPVLGSTIPFRCEARAGPVSISANVERNGGVVILGRHKLQHHEERLFHPVCVGEDCCVGKGVLYARFAVDGESCLHVFGTHLQNQTPKLGSRLTPRQARRGQLELMRQFMDDILGESSCPGPVIVAGDLNLTRDELPEAARILRAHIPQHFDGPPSYGPHNYYSAESEPEHLDYVLVTEDYEAPLYSVNETRIFKADRRVGRGPLGVRTKQAVADLSDHHPIAGHFEWGRLASKERLEVTLDAPREGATCAVLQSAQDDTAATHLCSDSGQPPVVQATAALGCASLARAEKGNDVSVCVPGTELLFCPHGLDRSPCVGLENTFRCVQVVTPWLDNEESFDDYLCYAPTERAGSMAAR